MEMQYRRLGNSGLKLSVLSFGSWVTFGTQLVGRRGGRVHVCCLRVRRQFLRQC